MSMKVKDLVKTIRACRTAAEERAVISKESALIRTAFKEEDTTYRQRNVAKLLFIHLLGYPTNFAQMQCVKLIASPRFSEKRIGYLGLTQLVDENSDILMLVTNSIGNDLQNVNQHVNGLALTALGNIADSEMCMALAQEVHQLMSVSNPYIRKKAILCAVRVVKKVEEVQDKFDGLVPKLLEDTNHGVLLATCALMSALLDVNREKYVKQFRKHLNLLVKTLYNIIVAGDSTSSEYDVSGVSDPFLQAKFLSVMRVVAENSQTKSDAVADIIAQVTTNTDGTKPAGNAVLYEAVRTIISIQADPSLRMLGVNILARFLQSKDNNLRYVALSMLQHIVRTDIKAVQRHRESILECLKEADNSIKRPALEVCFALINSENIKTMTKELLNLLLVASNDFAVDLVSKICLAVDRFAPNRRWQIDTIIKTMCLAGNYVRDEVRHTFIHVVAATSELQQYAVHKLYFCLHENMSQEVLVQTAVWCIGEFGDLLTSGNAFGSDGQSIKITASEVLDLLQTIADRPVSSPERPALGSSSVSNQIWSDPSGAASNFGSTMSPTSAPSPTTPKPSSATLLGSGISQITSGYLLTCLLKLTTRFPSEVPRIRRMIRTFTNSISIELQQRSCESDELLTAVWDETRSQILDHMPASLDKYRSIASRPTGSGEINEVPPMVHHPNEPKSKATSDMSNLLDLDFNINAQTTATPPGAATTSHQTNPGAELIANLLEGLDISAQPAAATVPSKSKTAPLTPNADTTTLADLLGESNNIITDALPISVPALNSLLTVNARSVAPFRVYDSNGLSIVFEYPSGISNTSDTIHILSKSSNGSLEEISNFVLEVAVPKSMKLEMQPADGEVLPPLNAGTISQKIIVDLAAARQQQKPFAMKLRLTFLKGGQTVTELLHVPSILPPGASQEHSYI